MKLNLRYNFSKKTNIKLLHLSLWLYLIMFMYSGTYIVEAKALYQDVKQKIQPKTITIENRDRITRRDEDVDYSVKYRNAKFIEPIKEGSYQERISKVAKQEGFEELGELLALAQCESSFNPVCEFHSDECINPYNNSYDRGFFQISRRYHPEVTDECAFDLECATKESIRIIRQRGFEEWTCGKIAKN